MDSPAPTSLVFLSKQLMKSCQINFSEDPKQQKSSRNITVYSFLSNGQEKLSQYLTESIFFFETFHLDCVLRRQHQRLNELVRRLKNVRNYEDNMLKSLKMDLYNIRNYSARKQPKDFIEEDSREMEVAKSDKDSDSSSENAQLASNNRRRSSKKKIVKQNQTGVNLIQHKANMWWKQVESKQRPDNLDPVFSSRYAETRRTLKLQQPGADSADQSAHNSPTYRKLERPTPLHYRDSLDLSSSRSAPYRSRQSQHGSSVNSPVAEITGYFVRIKRKKALVSFYNSFEKVLYEILSAKTLHELEYLKLEDKIDSLKYKLQVAELARMYHVDSLKKEWLLKLSLMQEVESCRAQYKLARAGRQKITHESQPLQRSQSTEPDRHNRLNSAASREFEMLLRQISSSKTGLNVLMEQMMDYIREYLEIKESLHGFSIGDESSIFSHFVQVAAQEMNLVQPLIGLDFRQILGLETVRPQSPRESMHTVESKSYTSSSSAASKRRGLHDTKHHIDKQVYSEKFSSDDDSDNAGMCDGRQIKLPQALPDGTERISSVVSLSLSPQMQRTTSVTADILEPVLVRRATSKDDDFKSRNLALRYKKLRLLYRAPNLVVFLVSEYKTKQLLIMKSYSQLTSDKSVYKNFSKPFSGTGQDEDVHDFVVRTVEMFKTRDKFYQIVEFMECGSLQDLMKSNKGTLSYEDTVLLLAKVLVCIESIHNMRCAHMKINPRTVLVSSQGRVKLNAIGKNLSGRLI